MARAKPVKKPVKDEPTHVATEDQVDMRDTVPQRIDDHGTKVEDEAGTGEIDSEGG